MGKKKVLMAVNSLGIGGNEMFVMNFFRHIDKTKFQVDFLIFDDSKTDFYDEVVAEGSKVYIVSASRKNKLTALISEMRQVKRLLKSEHYDVVHSNSCSFFGIFRAVVPAAFTKGATVFSHSHNPGMPKNTLADNAVRALFRWFLSGIVDMGLSCSDVAGESKYTKKFIASEKYAVIRNAIEADKFMYSEDLRNILRKKYGIDDKYILIGNVGRLSKQKNQSFLLEVFREIHTKNSSSALIIIGGGELEEFLKSKALELGISESVIFTGSVTNANEYYSAMDVFVMPSIYEGLPFTAVEAQINGLKCIFSECISKMTDISGKSEFLSLDDSVQKWAEVVMDKSAERINKDDLTAITYDYNIKNEVKKLERLYSIHSERKS